tara:strand:- start:1183 stop:1428 length:246 start_codon:yes stop_codon:yes gene_type:complete
MKVKLLRRIRKRFNIKIHTNGDCVSYDKKKNRYCNTPNFCSLVFSMSAELGMFWSFGGIWNKHRYKQNQLKLKKDWDNGIK